MELSRRSVLATGLGLGVAGWTLKDQVSGIARADDRSTTLAQSRAAASIEGTTLIQAAAPKNPGYTRLIAGPGIPMVVRADLAAPKPTRDDRRRALASFVQFTDLHLVDAESPMRFEWMTFAMGSAFRPQEALVTRGNTSLVNRVNALRVGPITGRPFDCMVSTGDNTDNMEHIELEWLMTVLNGGTLTPTTGDLTRWEGVQTRNNKQFWTPETGLDDDYKRRGFPQLPGFFGRVQASHTSPGLQVPWFSVFGNHDNSVVGVFPSSWPALMRVYTSDQKLVGPKSQLQQAAITASMATGTPMSGPLDPNDFATITVTPDERRRPFTPLEYVQAHLDPANTGAGPVGHGFTQNNLDANTGYYAFAIAPGITGISLDSTNRAGFTNGSIDHRQWQWLQARLDAGSSLHFDWLGRSVRRQVSDELFILFSHHTSDTMDNLNLPFDGTGIRHVGAELRGLIHRYPNVIAWVNGHTHANKITARPHRDPKRSWWEINTASHVDYPQHARLLEVCDNADGTLSIFTTLVESNAPYQASYDAGDVESMASLYRELSFNDIHRNPAAFGAANDLNTELLLAHPHR